MNVSTKLRNLRKSNNLTLKELSTKSGISISFISDIENRRRNPSIDTLEILAKALNVSVNEFFDENNKSTSKNSLSKKDKKSIEKDLKKIMEDFKAGEDGPAFYNGEELNKEDLELLEEAMEFALRTIKIKNKEKYTPKKYKK